MSSLVFLIHKKYMRYLLSIFRIYLTQMYNYKRDSIFFVNLRHFDSISIWYKFCYIKQKINTLRQCELLHLMKNDVISFKQKNN